MCKIDVRSIRSKGKVIGTIPYKQSKAEDPNSIDSPPCKGIILEISIRSLVNQIVEQHKCSRIDIIESLYLRVIDAKPMKKSNRISKPRDIAIEEQRRDDNKTEEMMNEEPLLTNRVSSVHKILNGYLI